MFLVFNAFEKVADEAVSAEISEKELIVVIDAGHGGELWQILFLKRI